MAKNFFKRDVWLITTIYRHKYITRADINRLWEHSQLNELHEKFSERTFHHHRDAIEEMFGIRILCDRSQGYYIANRDDWENDGIQEWLLESMAMNDLVNETSDMRDRSCRPAGSARRWRKKSAGCFRRIVKIPTSDD